MCADPHLSKLDAGLTRQARNGSNKADFRLQAAGFTGAGFNASKLTVKSNASSPKPISSPARVFRLSRLLPALFSTVVGWRWDGFPRYVRPAPCCFRLVP